MTNYIILFTQFSILIISCRIWWINTQFLIIGFLSSSHAILEHAPFSSTPFPYLQKKIDKEEALRL